MRLRDTRGEEATYGDLQCYITALNRRYARLLDLVKEIEWARRNGSCPYCHAIRNLHGGHKEGCEIGATLKESPSGRFVNPTTPDWQEPRP